MKSPGLRMMSHVSRMACERSTVIYDLDDGNRPAMRARSSHFKFDRKVKWKNLLPAFRPMFLKFLEETQQMPEDPENVDVLIEENLRDLRKNRKPEGYNREGSMRMIFPISKSVEFYIYGRGKNVEVARVAEQVSRVLQKHRLKHTIEWDRLTLFAEKM